MANFFKFVPHVLLFPLVFEKHSFDQRENYNLLNAAHTNES